MLGVDLERHLGEGPVCAGLRDNRCLARAIHGAVIGNGCGSKTLSVARFVPFGLAMTRASGAAPLQEGTRVGRDGYEAEESTALQAWADLGRPCSRGRSWGMTTMRGVLAIRACLHAAIASGVGVNARELTDGASSVLC